MDILIDREGRTMGPYPVDAVKRFLGEGKLFLHDLARANGEPEKAAVRLEELLLKHAPEALKGLSSGGWFGLRNLDPSLLFPFGQIFRRQWLMDRRLLVLAFAGVLPLLVRQVLSAFDVAIVFYGALTFYTSVLWALLFFHLFHTPQVQVRGAVTAFLFTALVGVPVLLVTYRWDLLRSVMLWTEANRPALRFVGYFLGVGIPEELCKAAVVYWLARRPGKILMPQTVMLYGLISGLGFGWYEGVGYQLGQYAELSGAAAVFMNFIRLSSCSFLHGIWTGTAGYFIAFAVLRPQHSLILLVIAIFIPAFAHAAYDTFNIGWISVVIPTLSTLLMLIYLQSAPAIWKRLRAP